MLDCDETIKAIRKSLRSRSSKSWSVTGGRGTAWGWISIKSPPARSTDEYGTMTDEESEELRVLLGLDRIGSTKGVNIPDSDKYYQEYLDRAAGQKPGTLGTQYWD